MPKYLSKKYKINSEKYFSYWTNNIKKYTKIYILLAPGSESGSFFKNIISKFDSDSLIISLDYPGRGDSTPILDNSIESIANEVSEYLDLLNLNQKKKIYLVGLSYGTAVAIELLKISNYRFFEVILVAPGEFINAKYHILIRTLFFPARFSERVRKFYRYILVKYLPDTFHNFPKNNLQSILYQWLGILDYSLDETFKCKTPCTIVAFAHDQIIRKGSILKIKKIFPNSLIILEIRDHHLNISELSRRVLSEILK